MIAEIVSFGGHCKDFAAIIRERRKTVHLIQESDSKITVLVRVATRDAKTGRLGYQTFDSFDVGGAKPEEVFGICKEAILRAPAAVKK